MKITLINSSSLRHTAIETDEFVHIENAFNGPILSNGDFHVSLFARDDGFEGWAWTGTADPMRALPDAVGFRIDPRGVTETDRGDEGGEAVEDAAAEAPMAKALRPLMEAAEQIGRDMRGGR